MALPVVYFLLLLFSVLPLYQATHCPSGKYCPAGRDCNQNTDFCESKTMTCSNDANGVVFCNKGIIIEFSEDKYDVSENDGLAQPILILSRPLECCTFHVRVVVEDISAMGNMDYTYQDIRLGYVTVKFAAGQTRAPVDIKIIDDIIYENSESFQLTIAEVSLPDGFIIGTNGNSIVDIMDNEEPCVRFERQSYRVREDDRSGSLPVTLILSNPTSSDIPVGINTVDISTSGCDYQHGPYSVVFNGGNQKSGTQRVTFRVNITDDDIYEEDESFNLVIDHALPNRIHHCDPYRSMVTITSDERPIRMSFRQISYPVNEDAGVVTPMLSIDKPSPCCLTVYAELINKTAKGRGEDFDFMPPISPRRYKFTFSAGDTCVAPDESIPIVDDKISEDDESFIVRIVKMSVPCGVTVTRDYTTVIIKDNDIGVCFMKSQYGINENNGPLEIKLKLDKQPPKDYNMQICDISHTANSRDYGVGPYNVTFSRNQRESKPVLIPIYRDNDAICEGNKYFELFIDGLLLPNGLVPCDPSTTNVTILDNEYNVCFSQENYWVNEGDIVYLELSISRKLAHPIVVKLMYSNGTRYSATPYTSRSRTYDYKPEMSVRIDHRERFSIRTMQDRIWEYNETFMIEIDDRLHKEGDCSCITKVTVTIVDDDFTAVRFLANMYKANNKNDIIKPGIELTNPIGYPIRVYLEEMNNTAKSGEDYLIHYRSPITIHPKEVIQPPPDNLHRSAEYRRWRSSLPGKRLFSIDAIDDDIVEPLEEYFYINITKVTDIDNITQPHLNVDKRDHITKLVIRDDDESELSIIDGDLDFSKAIYNYTHVQVRYKNGKSPGEAVLDDRTTKVPLNVTTILDVSHIKVCISTKVRNRVTKIDPPSQRNLIEIFEVKENDNPKCF